MKLKVSQTSQMPIYEQIKTQIREKIFSGELKAGEQLPSIRALARELQIGIITAKRAYDDLCNENILVSRQGKGVFAAEVNLEHVKERQRNTLKREMQQIYQKGKETGFTGEELNRIFDEVRRESGDECD